MLAMYLICKCGGIPEFKIPLRLKLGEQQGVLLASPASNFQGRYLQTLMLAFPWTAFSFITVQTQEANKNSIKQWQRYPFPNILIVVANLGEASESRSMKRA